MELMLNTHIRFSAGLMCQRAAAALILALFVVALRPAAAHSPRRDGDENPAKALIEQGAVAMRMDPEASKRDAERALQILRARPDADLEIRARLILCDYQAERDSAAASREADAAAALLPKATRAGLSAGILDCRGEILETAGENTQARALYEQAVAVAMREHDDEMLAQSLFSRGYLLGLQGEYALGLSDLRRSQALFDTLGKPLHALTVMNSIAILYNRMGDYAQARHIYSRAVVEQHAAGMQREEAVTLHNLGRAHEKLGEWDAARQSFNSALTLSRQLGYSRGEAYALRGLAAVSNATGDPRGALVTLDRADALQRSTPDARLRAQIQLARGVAYHELGRLTDSSEVLQEAEQIFRQADALAELNSTYSEQAAVFAALGNWRAAYDSETRARATSEKLLSNQLDQRFAALKVEFDTAAKDKENTALLRENASNERALAQGRDVRRLQATVIVLTVLLVLLLATLAVYQHRNTTRMRTLAMTDELTSVPNRRAVLGRLAETLGRADGAPCSILIIDIDHFKAINDHHGHPAGDEVLKQVAARIRAAVHEPAFFGRLGGEEFLVALPDTSLERARELAEEFREGIMSIDTVRWFADRRPVTASIGCAVSRPGTDSPGSMLKRADFALYAAKRGGRNCVRTEPETPTDVDTLLAQAQ
ncbi:MAG TPA: diguanylate cyclase [Steroidobacteraceae bacterium]|nr:diguanylate cyclase [Steroidobacteraceae bacterium]